MALKKPLVLTNGEIEQLQPGDFIAEVDLVSLTNNDAAAVAIGEVLYVPSTGGVKKARADAAGTAQAMYIAASAGAAAAAIQCQSHGYLAGALTGATPGTVYYLSPTTPGLLTATPPSTVGQFCVRIGQAVTATDLEIRIERFIKL
jgi:hypothetical protein